jgi:hypothetical protein
MRWGREVTRDVTREVTIDATTRIVEWVAELHVPIPGSRTTARSDVTD